MPRATKNGIALAIGAALAFLSPPAQPSAAQSQTGRDIVVASVGYRRPTF
jgi:hypothetical protein